MDENLITVYVRGDNQNRITAVDSSIFVHDTAGWLELDQSNSGSRDSRDAYALAQGNYFLSGLTDDTGAHRYIYAPDRSPAYREATAEELEQERAEIEAARVPVGPTAAEVERLDIWWQLIDLQAQISSAVASR